MKIASNMRSHNAAGIGKRLLYLILICIVIACAVYAWHLTKRSRTTEPMTMGNAPSTPAIPAHTASTKSEKPEEAEPPVVMGEELKRQISVYIDELRNNTGEEDRRLLHSHGLEMIPALMELAQDKSNKWALRHTAYANICAVVRDSKNMAFRQKYIHILLTAALADKNDDEGFQSRMINRLIQDFHAEDFSDETKDLIRSTLKPRPDNPVYGEILLCGVADMTDVMPILRGYVRDRLYGNFPEHNPDRPWDWWRTTDWQAIRALARLGDKAEIARAIRFIEEGASKQFQAATLWEQLQYIRQPEVVEYLNKYLQSDEKWQQGDGFGGYDTAILPEGRPVYPYAADALKLMLKGFPELKFWMDKDGQQQSNIAEVREWMNAHKGNWPIIR